MVLHTIFRCCLVGEKHPHVRGEDASSLPRGGQKRETPPRAWGRPKVRAAEISQDGNTPTCVGKTRHLLLAPGSRQKHPHVRGEDRWRTRLTYMRSETPPRAWGRPLGGIAIPRTLRNTPTCVGKTPTAARTAKRVQKHPHVRGEDGFRMTLAKLSVETPPRAWGRHGAVPSTLPGWRNTPTCVGKTGWWTQQAARSQKHPHVRGEDVDTYRDVCDAQETPPRAWGRPLAR